MNESEFQMDSMYEMDAPNCVDFNATDISVNESIFDRKTVGEKKITSNSINAMEFKSPSNIFRDIGNLSPRLLRSSLKEAAHTKLKTPSTPDTNSPTLKGLGRRVTRSASKLCDTTLTPKVEEVGILDAKPLWEQQIKTEERTNTHDICSSTESELTPLAYPKPKTYTPRKSPSPRKSPTPRKSRALIPENKDLKSSRASTGGLQRAAVGKLTSVRLSAGDVSGSQLLRTEKLTDENPKAKPLRVRTNSGSKPLQPAHSGTPFQGKRSPLKTLRFRTRSQESAATKPCTVTKSSASNSMHQRASSMGKMGKSAVSLTTKSSSQSSLPKRSTSLAGTKAISTSLSRLMKTTESARSKIQQVKVEPSPSKRKISGCTDARPPKLPRSTIPRSPNFIRRGRATPVKSTEEINLERIAREKKDMDSLRKMNEVGLKSISGSGRKRDASGSSHAMSTRSDGQTKAKRSIYDMISDKAKQSKTGESKQLLTKRAPSPRRDIYTRTAVTKPLSPKLQTSKRERQAKVPSYDERIQMELDQMKKTQFKAAPVDKNILEGTTGHHVKPKELLQVTRPMAMRFATDERMAKARVGPVEEPPVQETIKALPAPKAAPVFKPTLDHRSTSAKPFTFEGKDQASKRKRAELLQRVEEEERKLREFTAQPLPPSPTPLPPRHIQAATVPSPFQLRIDERGALQQEKFKRQVEAEHARMLEATIVRAKPADVLTREPFVPIKETAKPIEPFDIEMNSTRRAEQRKQYELQKQEAELKAAAFEAEMKRRADLRERQELIKLRKETIIKPAPIKQYKPIEIKKSDKPPTQAISPRFNKR